MTAPLNHHTLNPKQITILNKLSKYRFTTTELLSLELGNTSSRAMFKRCQILVDQEYIGRRYDRSYKLLGRPAAYYLTKKGIDALQQHQTDEQKLDPAIIKSLARDYRASKLFERHCLSIFRASIRLSEIYGPEIKFFSKSQLRQYRYFPNPLPDGYARYKDKPGSPDKHLMIECFDDTMPQSVMRQTIDRHVAYYDSGDWPPGNDYPLVIIFYQNDKLKDKLISWISRAQADSWNEAVQFKILMSLNNIA
jgi:hypothetical protein